MDITPTTAPRSDQQNYEDYIGGPKTVTVERVTKGSSEQPVNVHLVEFPGRPFKPAKTVRRILLAAWGKDADQWAGRRMTLYGDPSVKFGGEVVGGIRVSHLSHIDQPMTLSLTVSRGKRAPHTVEPLLESAAPAAVPVPDEVAAQVAAADEDELRAMWEQAPEDSELRGLIAARVAEIRSEQS